ncbi:MAG: hypothetical protein ABIR18_00850 [Chitinophagaceae bacterium]
MTNIIDSNSVHPLLKRPEVSIRLRSYNDLFSDFDPSAYPDRTLSDDFILHAKEIFKSKSGGNISLRLLLPENSRNDLDERLIIERLKAYFISVYTQLKSEVRKANAKGLTLIVIGIILMIGASYISFMKPDKYHVHLLLVLFEPAGWFLLWVGLDHLVYSLKDTKRDITFYLKMTKSEINFSSNETEYDKTCPVR